MLDSLRNGCYIVNNGHSVRCCFAPARALARGTQVRTASCERAGSSDVVHWPPKAGLTTLEQSQSGRRVHSSSFEQIEHHEHLGTDRTSRTNGTVGTNRLFSILFGTAGQRGLNIKTTTTKCPARLSHFRDRWDTFGTVGHGTKPGPLGTIRTFWYFATPVTLQTFLKTWDKITTRKPCPK
jgi:hypothetical protein